MSRTTTTKDTSFQKVNIPFILTPVTISNWHLSDTIIVPNIWYNHHGQSSHVIYWFNMFPRFRSMNRCGCWSYNSCHEQRLIWRTIIGIPRYTLISRTIVQRDSSMKPVNTRSSRLILTIWATLLTALGEGPFTFNSFFNSIFTSLIRFSRSCIGMHFANQGLFIVMATMLWAVDILPCTDESGEVVIPTASEWDYDGITA